MYNITIFPRGTLSTVDTTKEALRLHKAQQGKECIIGESRSCNNLEEVLNLAAQFPAVFSELRDNRRAGNNLLSTRLAVIDIDEHFTIDQAQQILEDNNLEYALYTSYSHRVENRDKFHIILTLSEPVSDIEVYKATYREICKIFHLQNDGQTCSPANLFFNSNPETVETFYSPGNAFNVVKIAAPVPAVQPAAETSAKLELSRRTMRFLLDGAPAGEWHIERNLATKDMKACGYSIDKAKEKIKRITGKLDVDDVYQIEYGYRTDNWEYTPVTSTAEAEHKLRADYLSPKGKPLNIPAKAIVDVYFRDNHVTASINEQFYVEGKITPLDALIEDIRHFSESQLKQQTPVSYITSVISRKMLQFREDRLNDLRNFIQFNNTVPQIHQLLPGISSDLSDATAAVLLHFIWQVKRKIFDKTVSYHMMPVLVGRSGSGKTEFIKRLIEPIKDVCYLDGDFKKLVDSREAFNLVKNYVYLMDEMSKADSADVETIKSRVTSSIIQYRKLGTNIAITGTNNATFIGASNLDLDRIIKDPTSSRRFFQIDVPDNMDWEKINNFNYLDLWRSVDENQDSPYIMPFLEEIQQTQQDYKYLSPLEIFINDFGISKDESVDAVAMSRDQLFRSYQEWSSSNGYKFTIDSNNFKADLRRLLGEPRRKRSKSNPQRVYYVRKNNPQNLTLVQKD